jgi:trafficking protein particle complex subunit 9
MLPTITVKPIPKTSTGRPRSVNGYSHLAVSSNIIPPTRTPSPSVSFSAFTVPAPHRSFSLSQPNLAADNQPSIPAPTPSLASTNKAAGETIKRSTTGLGFGSKVSRVVSGKVMEPSITSPVSTVAGSSSSTGRLKKLQADFWLLSGRLNEAISSYTDAISSLKSNNDHLWWGAALEGLATATMLEAWETRVLQSDSHIPFTASPILTDVHDNLNAAYAAYTRTPCPPPSMFQHGTVQGEAVMARLFSVLALKHARLLFLTWAAGGHGTPSMNAITYLQIPRAYPPFNYAYRRRVFTKLSTISRMARTLIVNVASRAHGPWLMFLSDAVRLEVLVTLATLSRLLALERREAFFLREVVGTVMTMLAERRAVENKTDDRAGAAQTAITNGDRPDDLTTNTAVSQALSEGKIAVRRKESSEGNEALLGMLERICDIFGLDFTVSQMPELGCYGWPELQVEIVKEAVYMTEALPGESGRCCIQSKLLTRHLHADPRRTVQYCQMALRTLYLNLTASAQYFLFEKSMRALETARRRGLELDGLPWWVPGSLLSSVCVLP